MLIGLVNSRYADVVIERDLAAAKSAATLSTDVSDSSTLELKSAEDLSRLNDPIMVLRSSSMLVVTSDTVLVNASLFSKLGA